jgi:hypothetical protein
MNFTEAFVVENVIGDLLSGNTAHYTAVDRGVARRNAKISDSAGTPLPHEKSGVKRTPYLLRLGLATSTCASF